MKKVIEHLQKINEKYEATKRTYEDDLKRGFKGMRKYFDPVYYDEQGHKEVLEAIEVLSKLHQPTVVSSVCNFCGSENLEYCGGGEFTCNDCGHFPITN